jgi:hypothetical protein
MTPPAPDATHLAPADNTYNPRRASEQDAAVMLMHMRGQEMRNGEQKENEGQVGDDRRGHGCPKDNGHGDGHGDENGEGTAGKDDSATNDAETKPSCSPSPIVVEIRTPTPTTGPNTRAKRRRTLMK